jgi:hypothetical protein
MTGCGIIEDAQQPVLVHDAWILMRIRRKSMARILRLAKNNGLNQQKILDIVDRTSGQLV